MKVLAFAASNSRQSINKQLVTHAASLIPEADVEILDLNDFALPLFSVDAEEELGHPEAAKAFLAKIAAADALLISFAEHNGSYSAAYKNLFDWCSRIEQKVFQGKPVALLATSPGPGGGKNVLATAVSSAPFFAAEVRASLSVARFFDVFDAEKGEITDEAIRANLAKVVRTVLPANPI